MQEVPADSGNLPWYMTDSIAVLEDSYSEVVVNVIDLALNWQGGGGGGYIRDSELHIRINISPPPTLGWIDVVYKNGGGRINGTLRYIHNFAMAMMNGQLVLAGGIIAQRSTHSSTNTHAGQSGNLE